MRFVPLLLLCAAPAGLAAPPSDADSAAFWEAKTAALAADRADAAAREYPAVTAVGMAAPGLLSVTVLEGLREPGAFGPYGEEPGDKLSGDGTLTRGGEPVGKVVGAGGPRGPQFWAFDAVNGTRVDRDRLDDPAAWAVAADGTPLKVTAVSRKSTPRGRARDGSPYNFVIFEHACFLSLDSTPRPGQTLKITHAGRKAGGGDLKLTASERFDPRQTESVSIHCNQHGWAPEDAAKRAYLSLWLPPGAAAADGLGAVDFRTFEDGSFPLRFEVVPDGGGEPVCSGPVVHRKGPSDVEDAEWQLLKRPDGSKVNYAGTHVFEMNFGPDVWPDPEPGEYVVSVAGLGCSRPFRVDDGVWEDAFRVAMAGLYNHRAGVELDGRFGYARPRTLHPDDGFTVYRSALPITVTSEGPASGPVEYQTAVTKYLTDETAPGAWGGLNDAGDWDRRTQHLEVVYDLCDLYSLFPGYFGAFGLNLPDTAGQLPAPVYAGLTGNADVPDVLAEALFTLDFFRRLQDPDGGVSGGIEEARRDASENRGETSWTTDETPFLYAPDAWTTYWYAATCAKAAAAFDRAGFPELADLYTKSGRRAWRWAEANRDPAAAGPFLDAHVADGDPAKRAERQNAAEKTLERIDTETAHARAWAAAEWWRRTGDGDFKTAMLGASDEFSKGWPTAPDGALSRAFRATAANPHADDALRTFCLASLARFGTEYGTDVQANMAFRQSKHLFVQYYYGAGTSPASLERAEAWLYLANLAGPVAGPVTQLADTTPADRRAGLTDALSFTLGGNPRNLSFVIGLGDNPAGVLNLDSYTTGAAPPVGIVQYGFHKPQFSDGYWWLYRGGEAWSELWDGGPASGTPRRAIEPDRKLWPTVESFVDHPFYPMDTEYTVQQGVAGLAYLAGVLAATGDGAEPTPAGD